MNPLSKKAQLSRSPGGNRVCPRSGLLRTVCDGWESRGWRNQNSGKRSQARARRSLQRVSGRKPAAGTRSQASHEEFWRGVFRLEVKSGKQVNVVVAKFLEAEAQAFQAKAIGDLRPFCFAAEAEGMTDQVWSFRSSDLERVLEALRG